MTQKTTRLCTHCGNHINFVDGRGECDVCKYVYKLEYTHIGDYITSYQVKVGRVS